MLEIKGQFNTAICYATVIEEEAVDQIRRMCDYEFTAGSRVRIMPDVHAGKSCTIGTTMTIVDKVVPNIVGVDIGCGMYTLTLGDVDIDFARVDEAAHAIPSGTSVWDRDCEPFAFESLRCFEGLTNLQRLGRSIGTLGGGNHFIEIDAAEDGTKYLVVHSGSRNLGHQVARYYQKLAVELHRENESDLPDDLCYLYGSYLEDYLHDVAICQDFARRNREIMAEIILDMTGMTSTDEFHTIHNYIDTEEMILRKGAIAAHKNEKVLIPINMRDGSVLAYGKGNEEWNYSAPHGAGRLMSRSGARETLDMEEYRRSMEGIYTTSVSTKTLDEAPMAYKALEDIIGVIQDSVDIIEVLKPVYNFKAAE